MITNVFLFFFKTARAPQKKQGLFYIYRPSNMLYINNINK